MAVEERELEEEGIGGRAELEKGAERRGGGREETEERGVKEDAATGEEGSVRAWRRVRKRGGSPLEDGGAEEAGEEEAGVEMLPTLDPPCFLLFARTTPAPGLEAHPAGTCTS